jgi:AbiJ-like protein
MKFSERVGAVRRVLQKDSVDEPLKNSPSNVTHQHFWGRYPRAYNEKASAVPEGALLFSIWTNHFNKMADDALSILANRLKQIRELYVAGDWLDVYDFMEFVVNYPRPKNENDQLIADLYSALESTYPRIASWERGSPRLQVKVKSRPSKKP